MQQIEVTLPRAKPAFVRENGARALITRPTLFGCDELRGTVMTFGCDEEIFGEGEPADYVCKVLDGAVRRYTILSDGRRQIGGFSFAGEIFGLQHGERHTSSADLLGDSRIMVTKRSRVLKCAGRNSDVAYRLWSVTAHQLRRSEAHASLLMKTARERVAAFLLDIAQRLAKDTIQLLMCRQDIADYLGLTIETVSRCLSQLSEARVIELAGSRRITLRNRPALCELNG